MHVLRPLEVHSDYPYLLRLYGVSEAEFDALVGEDLKAEYIDGVVIVHSPASFSHEDRQAFLLTLLRLYVEAHGIGRVVGSNALFQAGSRQFSPDIMVISSGTPIVQKKVMGPPLLAVEILSESTRDYDLGEKRIAYREAGVREIWWVDEKARVVMVEQQGDSYRTERVSEGWVTSEAVPGFRIRAEWLWREPLPSVVECWDVIRQTESGG